MATINQKVLRAARHHGVPILGRGQWGAKYEPVYQYRRKFKKHSLVPKIPADTLIQHISVTRDTGRTPLSFREDMRTIERIGWERFKTGFSYNAGWDMQTGMIGIGMPLDAKGSHTMNDKRVPNFSWDQNAVALAIVAIGMPGAKPSLQAVDILSTFVGVLMVQGALDIEGFDYEPHSKFAAKDCPTQPVRDIMPYVYREAMKFARNH